VSPGVSVAVYGAGPVGPMAAYSALLRGAAKVFVVDRVPERLQKAEEIGARPDQGPDRGEGTDTGVDAVGYQAQAGREERDEPAVVLNSLVDTVRATGALGVPGL
jgi:glutathione-independent formaldehyde dehydrogenase